MALTFETSGEQMPISFGGSSSALAQLQPLQFQQIAIPNAQIGSPISFVPSKAGEKIASGISSAIGEIGKGITAAYSIARDREKEIRDQQHQKELKQMELAAARTRSEQTLQNQKDLAAFNARLKDTTPKGSHRFLPVPRPNGTEKMPQQPASGPLSSIYLQDTFDQESEIPNDREYEGMKGVGGAGEDTFPPAPDPDSPKEIRISNPPLSNLTSPVQGNQFDVFKELNSLGPIDVQYKTADIAAGPSQAQPAPVGESLNWLRKPASVMRQAGAAPQSYEETSGLLKTITTPADIAAQNAKAAAVSGETPLSAAVAANERPPRGRFQYEEDALDYIQQHGKNSNWFAKESPVFDSLTGTWSVKWEQKDPVKAAQMDATRQMAKDRLSRLDQAGLASEVNNFLKDPINKIMQARPMQIAEFEAAKDEAFDPESKKSRRAVDLDAIDKFVMFARGTQPTEAQYSEIQNWTQGYLQDVKQKIEKGVEGARLSENDYETMMNLMYRAYNTTASLVNPEIQDLREIVKAKHPSLMEKELPQAHMYYEVPSYFREKVNDAQEEMRQYHALMQLAKEQKNKAAYDDANAKYAEAKKMQDKYIQDLARAKASKKPLNKKQFKRGGWKQGIFGGVSDLNAAGASQEGQ